MKRKKLYIATDDGNRFLSFDEDAGDSSVEATPADETIEAMTQLLDEDAENCNAHDFVCCHRGLAAILMQEVGRKAATAVMRRLVNYDGLHGLTGVCGKGDVKLAEKELGLSLHDWSEWRLPIAPPPPAG